MTAIVNETHSGVARALKNFARLPATGTAAGRRAPLAAALLRAAAALITATPYDRLPRTARGARLSDALCSCAVALLQSPVPAVSVAALGVLSSAFTNATAVDDGDGSRAAAMLAALLTHGARAAVPGVGASGATVVVRAEVLTVISRATRHCPALVAAQWPAVSSLLLDAFADAAPTVRTAALRCVEESLRARAGGGVGGGAGRGGAVVGQGGEDNIGGGDADDIEDGGVGAEQHGSSTAASAAREIWRPLDSVEGGGAAVSISPLLRTYFPAALRDVSPAVRAAAVQSLCYVLPSDWGTLLGVCSSSGEPIARALPTSVALAERDELLNLLAGAIGDATPSVRVAAAKTWGSYLALPHFKTPAICRLAGRLLLALITDPVLAVRAKASWALGNL